MFHPLEQLLPHQVASTISVHTQPVWTTMTSQAVMATPPTQTALELVLGSTLVNETKRGIFN